MLSYAKSKLWKKYYPMFLMLFFLLLQVLNLLEGSEFDTVMHGSRYVFIYIFCRAFPSTIMKIIWKCRGKIKEINQQLRAFSSPFPFANYIFLLRIIIIQCKQ